MLTAAVHRLVERHAALRGDEVALVGESGTLTYRELNQRSNALARHLIDTGLRRGSHVIVRMDPSPELGIVLLAVLKAGAAYSWFDIVDDCDWPEGATILSTADDGGTTRRVIDLQQALDAAGHTHANLPILTKGTDIACVLPGRDGMPPVMVPHATSTALRSQPLPHQARWSMEQAALDLWLPLMAGTTVTLTSLLAA